MSPAVAQLFPGDIVSTKERCFRSVAVQGIQGAIEPPTYTAQTTKSVEVLKTSRKVLCSSELCVVQSRPVKVWSVLVVRVDGWCG